MVPHVPHTSAFLEKLNVGSIGQIESVEYDCGHELTEEGILKAADWVRMFGLEDRGEERKAGL